MATTLTTAPGTGVLNFKSTPLGASMTIDDMDYANTPVTINNVPVGRHSFVLKMEGYKDFEDTIEVVENKLCCANIDLQAIRSELACNPQTIEAPEVPVPPPSGVSKPDYTLLAIVFLAGVVIALLYKGAKDEHKRG